jgi:hypothetical protein
MFRDDVKAPEIPGEMDRSYLIPHVAKSRPLGALAVWTESWWNFHPAGFQQPGRGDIEDREIVPSRSFNEKGVSTGKSRQLGNVVRMIQL